MKAGTVVKQRGLGSTETKASAASPEGESFESFALFLVKHLIKTAILR